MGPDTRFPGSPASGISGSPGRSGPSGTPRERGIPDALLVGGLAFLLGLTLLVWAAAGLAGLLAHGAWPEGVEFTRTPLAMRHLVAQPHDLAGAWPHTPAKELPGYGLFWGVFISELMVLFVLTVFAIGAIARWRVVRATRTAHHGKAGGAAAARTAEVGYAAPAAEGAAAVGTEGAAALDGGPVAEPAPVTASTGPEVQEVRAPGDAGAVTGPAPVTETPSLQPLVPPQRVSSGLHFTGPRSESRRALALRAVAEADGPLLVTTSDPALWADTKDARAKLGPLHVYDPSHLLDTPARLRWSPTDGCEDRAVAAARAAALLAPVRPAHALDSAMAEVAETLMRCWLHAAAVDGRPFRQVHRWAQGSAAHEPVRILRTNRTAAAGAAGELEAALTAHSDRREVAQALTAHALSALSSVHIRDACNPGRVDGLALESFIAEGGTLYVVGEPIEDPRTHPGAMPLLTAVVASVVERGRRMAERSSAGRLDPPLSLVLDDVAAVAPLPQLPELLSDGEALGLPTLALLRSEEQARARWPHKSLAG